MTNWKKAFYSIIDVVVMDRHSKRVARHLSKVLLYELKGRDTLDPPLKEKFLKLQTRMQELGKPIWIVEGFRSAIRQRSLSSNVTKATDLQSYHQYGIAFDVAFKFHNWTPPEYNWWYVLGEEGEKLGLIWGGRWKNIVDVGHFELHQGFTWRDLKHYFERSI